MQFFHTVRDPFPIAAHRVTTLAFIAVRVTPANDLEIYTIAPGRHITVCDIEDDSVLFRIGKYWYRALLDEFTNATVDTPTRSSVAGQKCFRAAAGS